MNSTKTSTRINTNILFLFFIFLRYLQRVMGLPSMREFTIEFMLLKKKSCWIQWDTDSDFCQEIKVSKCQSNLPLHAYVPKQILWLDYIIVAETHSNLASLYVTVFYDKNIHAPKPYRLKEKKCLKPQHSTRWPIWSVIQPEYLILIWKEISFSTL